MTCTQSLATGGEITTFNVSQGTTLRQFKELVLESLCSDEVMSKVTEVQLLMHEKPLMDDGITLNGVSDELFLAILSPRAVTCVSKQEAGCDLSLPERGVLLYIPDGTTEISEMAFMDCGSIVSATLPDSVTAIRPCAFSGCSSLTALKLPDALRAIDRRAFRGCTALRSLTIPPGVTEIGAAAFAGSGLRSLWVPESVALIGAEAFSGCAALADLYIPSTTKVRPRRSKEKGHKASQGALK